MKPIETTTIKMTKATRGADDAPGSGVKLYEAGETYPVGPELARAFVDELKVAERTGLAGVADKVEAATDKVVEAVTGKKAKKDDPAKD